MRTRKHRVEIYLNDMEYEHLKTIVSKSGFNREAYLRSIIKGIVPDKKPSADATGFIVTVQQIKNNLAYLSLYSKDTETIRQCRESIEAIEKATQLLYENLY